MSAGIQYYQPTTSIASGALTPAEVTSGFIAQNAVTSGNIGSGAVTGQAGGGAFDVASGTLGTYDHGSGTIVRGAQFVTPFQSGTSWSLITEEIVSGIRAVMISPSGNIRVAMASVSGRMPAIGIVVDGVLSGIPANVYQIGMFQTTSGLVDYSGQLGKPVWVGRSGQVVSWSGSFNSGGLNVASGGDFIQRIGVIVNSGAFVVGISPDMGQNQLLGTTTIENVVNRQFGV